MPLLFVYGTLRTPIGGPEADTHYHHRIETEIERARGARLEEASLYDFGAYPGVGPGDGAIIGEVFEISVEALEEADRIEGHPHFYERRLENVLTDEGPVEAWVYWAPADLTRGHPVVRDGDWLTRERIASSAPPLVLPDDTRLAAVIARIAAEECSWVSSVRPDGRPHAVPMWHVVHGNRLYVVTPVTSVKRRNLRSNPAVIVSLPDPLEVVIVDGWAIEAPGALGEIRGLFESKYGWDPGIETEGSQVILEIAPQRVTSWNTEGEKCQWSLPGSNLPAE